MDTFGIHSLTSINIQKNYLYSSYTLLSSLLSLIFHGVLGKEKKTLVKQSLYTDTCDSSMLLLKSINDKVKRKRK